LLNPQGFARFYQAPTVNHQPVNLEMALVAAWPPDQWRDVHVLLAVSGGADSVAMLRATLAAKDRAGGPGRLHVAHLNHGIRPADAAADAAWVENLCRRLRVPVEVGRSDVPALAATVGDGLEAAARQARYDFLRSTAERLGARFVAVAHTADDQVETVLHRLVRGTGLTGLAGMPRVRPLAPNVSLVRPLLAVRRTEVLRYLAQLGQDYRSDPSNTDPRFTRNRLRHDLLPLVRSAFNADFDRAVLRLAQQADEAQQVIAAIASRLFCQSASVSADRVQIDCNFLAPEPSLVIREVCKLAWTGAGWPLQDMGFDQWQQLAQEVRGREPSGVWTLPGGVRVERRGNTLELTQASSISHGT
jgi:tRNA(Ile)-lysidine synthase